MGALIVVGDGPEVLNICSGGFLLDAAFSPQRLSELAKTDGAIILAPDASRIARANVHLVPEPERAHHRDRHPAPHRRAGRPVDRRPRDLGVARTWRCSPSTCTTPSTSSTPIPSILNRCNQALQTLERYKARLSEVGHVAHRARDRGPGHGARRGHACCSAPRSSCASPTRSSATSSSSAPTAGWSACSCASSWPASRTTAARWCSTTSSPTRRGTSSRPWRRCRTSRPTSCSTPRSVAEALHLSGGTNDLEGSLQPRGYRILSRVPRLPDRARLPAGRRVPHARQADAGHGRRPGRGRRRRRPVGHDDQGRARATSPSPRSSTATTDAPSLARIPPASLVGGGSASGNRHEHRLPSGPLPSRRPSGSRPWGRALARHHGAAAPVRRPRRPAGRRAELGGRVRPEIFPGQESLTLEERFAEVPKVDPTPPSGRRRRGRRRVRGRAGRPCSGSAWAACTP